jgi:lipoprotein-releasing system ATP-binding protein
MIIAKAIKKSYATLDVLKGIDFSVSAGEVVSVVGASGAGKSTLLHILGTLDRADSGTLDIGGTPISKLNDRELAQFRNRNIGFVFQFHHLLPEFTAIENVMMPAFIAGKNHKEAMPHAQKLLSFLGLSARVQHKPNELSGGEQQRVAVARALMNSPKVVFADEPSGNLDSDTAQNLHRLFFDLRDEFKQTFVIVTHNEELANMADRKIVMKDGLISQVETIRTITPTLSSSTLISKLPNIKK